MGNKSFGKRAKFYQGRAPLRSILQAEVTGEHIEKKPSETIDWDAKKPVKGNLESGGQTGRDGQLLITISGSDDIRDELRSVVRDHLTDRLTLYRCSATIRSHHSRDEHLANQEFVILVHILPWCMRKSQWSRRETENNSLRIISSFLDTGGTVKITSHKSCKRTSSKQDLNALDCIAMELMQKYPNSGGSIGLEDFEHWPSDSDAVSFLAMTTLATSLEQLLSHPFLDCDWRGEDLKWLMALAAITTHRGWRYE